VSGYIHIFLHTCLYTLSLSHTPSHTHTPYTQHPHTHSRWTASGLMQRLQHEKHVVAEPRGGGAEVVHLFSERDLYTCQKRPVHMSKETITPIKRKQDTNQQSPEHMSKKTYKRDLYTCQKKPTKQNCTHVKKRPVHMSKRDLYTYPTKPIHMSKETCKRDLLTI